MTVSSKLEVVCNELVAKSKLCVENMPRTRQVPKPAATDQTLLPKTLNIVKRYY